MDPDGSPGEQAGPVRAARHAGFLTPADTPDTPDAHRRAEGREGVAIAFLGYAAGWILSMAGAYIAAAACGYNLAGSAPLPLAVTAGSLIGLWLGLVGTAVRNSRKRGSGSLAADYGYRIGAWWDIPFGVALGLACQYGLVPALYKPFEHADHNLVHQLSQPTQKDVGAVHTSAAAVIVVVLLALGAPLVEELFFRGLLLRSLLKWTNPVAAVVISGILFGLAHGQLLQLLGLTAFGIVLGLVAWKTGRLGPTVSAHMSFNAAAVLTTVHLH